MMPWDLPKLSLGSGLLLFTTVAAPVDAADAGAEDVPDGEEVLLEAEEINGLESD